jgi:hypothetical protein
MRSRIFSVQEKLFNKSILVISNQSRALSMSRRGRSAGDNCGSSQNLQCSCSPLEIERGWMRINIMRLKQSHLNYSIFYVPGKGNKNCSSFGLNLNPEADRKYLTEFLIVS